MFWCVQCSIAVVSLSIFTSCAVEMFWCVQCSIAEYFYELCCRNAQRYYTPKYVITKDIYYPTFFALNFLQMNCKQTRMSDRFVRAGQRQRLN